MVWGHFSLKHEILVVQGHCQALKIHPQALYVNYEPDRAKGNDIWSRHGFYTYVCYCHSILNLETWYFVGYKIIMLILYNLLVVIHKEFSHQSLYTS